MVHMKKQEWMTGPTFTVDDMIDPALSGYDSPSSSTTAPKRKRASRPKVRTGCITCKIRRVKCDETKPACTRCTSTGRKCDGYEGAAPPRPRKSPSAPPSSTSFSSSTSTSNSAFPLSSGHRLPDPYRHSNFTAGSAHRNLRPLAADIEGTEQERQFFHRFRRAAEAGLAMHASSLGAGFWRRLVPLVGQSDAAVRHALIALGAAHQSAQLQQEQVQVQAQTQGRQMAGRTGTDTSMGMEMGMGTTALAPRTAAIDSVAVARRESPEITSTPQQRHHHLPHHPHQQHQQQQSSSYISTPPPEDSGSSSSACVDQLELFMIQQYNLSIYHLQQHVQPGSPPSSVEITLICCLVFVCIETSRGNEAAALAHVANGLQIIRALPPDLELVHFPLESSGSRIRGGGGGGGSAISANGVSPRISRSDWRQLLDFFLALEPSAATYGFTSSQPPTPPCPTMSTWETPLECFDEMLPQWEMEAGEVDI
ncbi:hypothetical protein F4806DRAFT_463028 [Annulohypoxylon nitens]|nr:hypothetical protein F4806DRAFT_463028 [Annulohypoxylon nitens]